MDGYRYWVERHKLLIALADEKDRVEGMPEREREVRTLELERAFRQKLDTIYGEARAEFVAPPPPNKN
jgi:hypothetical protein